MKFAVLTILLLLSVGASRAQDTDRTSEVKRWHEKRDEAFRNRALTPLTSEDLTNFKGLEYFDATEKFVVKARFEKTDDTQIFMMPTSYGKPLKYFKRGILKFEIDGKSFSLTAFQSETAAKKNAAALFVPFRDLTSGAETYGAGRYLDIKIPADAEVTLDFNYAFNPNCAYGNEQYVCPVAPRENFLQIEIKAGEKTFPYAAKKQ